MPATFWTSALSNLTRGIAFRHRSPHRSSLDLSRLSAHDLADLNLPSDVRARVDLQREANHWERANSWFGR